MTAVQVLQEVRAAGGELIPEGGRLRMRFPSEPPARLQDAIRERKRDLLMLLRPLELPCLACGGTYSWQDSVGAQHCGQCEPDPRARYLRGVTLETLGNRPIVLRPPTADLAAPGSWAKTRAGAVVEAVLYRDDGGEVLTRSLKGERLAWYAPEQLSWEIDWGWGQ